MLKVINEPRIYIVGEQVLNRDEVNRFLEDEDTVWTWRESDDEVVADGLRIAELGGRLCYMSFGTAQSKRTNVEYLQNIIEQQHGSVLEHAVWTFIITGVSRSLTHELIRHRVGVSPSQLSQRYVKYAEDFEVVIPPDYMNEPVLIEQWLSLMAQLQNGYIALADKHTEILEERNESRLAAGMPPLSKRDRRIRVAQAARSVLPNATETKIQLTMNARAIRHILEMRGSQFAELEIRRLAVALARVMQRQAPALFADVMILRDDEGVEYLTVDNHTV